MLEALSIPGPMVVRLKKHEDERGWFIETFIEAVFREANLPRFVQDNESMSRRAGTVRGLHFQSDPFAQAKLIRCVAGSVFDVAVDIRHGSPTFGKHVSLRMAAGDGVVLYVPVGFAHGFCTTAADTIMHYKVSRPYSPPHDKGVMWDDPALGINWPVAKKDAVLSGRDQKHPRLAELPAAFI